MLLTYRHIPYKDEQCIRHRYFESMGRHYKVYGIDKGAVIYDSIIVMRELNYNGVNICKIVDFIGRMKILVRFLLQFKSL